MRLRLEPSMKTRSIADHYTSPNFVVNIEDFRLIGITFELGLLLFLE